MQKHVKKNPRNEHIYIYIYIYIYIQATMTFSAFLRHPAQSLFYFYTMLFVS